MHASPRARPAEPDSRALFYSLQHWQHHARRYAQFHKPSIEVHLNLIFTYGVIASHFARRLSEHSLSLSAGKVLMILSESDNAGRPLHEIGELLLVGRANITSLADSLERRGLLERAARPGDRRVRLARLTKAGGALLESILPEHYAEIRKIYTRMTRQERTALNRLLTKLRKCVPQPVEITRRTGVSNERR